MKKIFYWRFSRKIEGEFWIFYKRFPWEKNWMEEIFKGISLKNWSWIHTRASLARAVFSFKTFFDCEWRSHLLSPTTSTSWNEKNRRFWSSLARYEVRLLQVNCEWSEVSEWKVIRFWSFIFPGTYIYYRSYIYIYRYKRKLCTTTFLWV